MVKNNDVIAIHWSLPDSFCDPDVSSTKLSSTTMTSRNMIWLTWSSDHIFFSWIATDLALHEVLLILIDHSVEKEEVEVHEVLLTLWDLLPLPEFLDLVLWRLMNDLSTSLMLTSIEPDSVCELLVVMNSSWNLFWRYYDGEDADPTLMMEHTLWNCLMGLLGLRPASTSMRVRCALNDVKYQDVKTSTLAFLLMNLPEWQYSNADLLGKNARAELLGEVLESWWPVIPLLFES